LPFWPKAHVRTSQFGGPLHAMRPGVKNLRSTPVRPLYLRDEFSQRSLSAASTRQPCGSVAAKRTRRRCARLRIASQQHWFSHRRQNQGNWPCQEAWRNLIGQFERSGKKVEEFAAGSAPVSAQFQFQSGEE
jgi:hypothetical protein